MPGGGNCIPAGGEPAAAPPGGAGNPGGREGGIALGMPDYTVRISNIGLTNLAALTRWETRRWCESWWETLWKRRHACKALVFCARSSNPIFL